MSSLLDMPGDQVANRLLQLGADFVRLISDTDGAAQRLADLAAAQAAAEAKITEARQARRGADERIAEVERELAEHNDRMLADRQVLQREREAFAKERAAVLDEANKLRDQARSDADAAGGKLKELNAKLAAIQSAVSSAA